MVAVVGRPNAGKSTLVNRIVGEHVAIVSPKAQTTRRPVRAVLNAPSRQVVFVDLPGSQKPVDRLTARMQSAVLDAVSDVDAVLWVVDLSAEAREGERKVADLAFDSGVPVVIAGNKVDRIKPGVTLERMAAIVDIVGEREFAALVPVSATAGDGVDVLVRELFGLVPEGPAYFPPGEVTDMQAAERIAEYVREAALSRLRDELPHATIVEVSDLHEEGGMLHVDAIIWVERDSQVGIVVGRAGESIRDIGTRARTVIETAFDTRCFLQLRAKVRRRWRDDDTQLDRWGL